MLFYRFVNHLASGFRRALCQLQQLQRSVGRLKRDGDSVRNRFHMFWAAGTNLHSTPALPHREHHVNNTVLKNLRDNVVQCCKSTGRRIESPNKYEHDTSRKADTPRLRMRRVCGDRHLRFPIPFGFLVRQQQHNKVTHTGQNYDRTHSIESHRTRTGRDAKTNSRSVEGLQESALQIDLREP